MVIVSLLGVFVACGGQDEVENPEPPPPDPPVPVAEGARHPARQLGRFLEVDRSEIAWDPPQTSAPRGSWAWPECNAPQAAAATGLLGPLQGCTASSGLMAVSYGPPQDCPAGCFYDQAVGRWDGTAFVPVGEPVWQWLRAPREELVGALLVPWGDRRSRERRQGLSIVCDRTDGAEPDASTPGRVAKVVFRTEDTCVATWTVEEPSTGAAPLPAAVVELGISGTLWIRDDGTLDGSELRFAPRHAQLETHTVLERSHSLQPAVTAREVRQRRPDPPPGTLCEPATPRDRLPRRLDACGPSGGLVAVVGFVIDGHLDAPLLSGSTPLDPKFEACAVEALTAAELGPTGCVALPVAAWVSGELFPR